MSEARALTNLVGNDVALRQFEIERRSDQLPRDYEELLGKRHQLIGRQTTMSFIHGLGQCVGDAGANPDHRGFFDAELHGDRISGLEADAANVAREPIRIFGHDLDGVGPVGLKYPHRPGC